MIECIGASIHSSDFFKYGMLKSRIPQYVGSLCFGAIGGCSDSRPRIHDGSRDAMSSPGRLCTSSCPKFAAMVSGQTIASVRSTSPPLCTAIDETSSGSNTSLSRDMHSKAPIAFICMNRGLGLGVETSQESRPVERSLPYGTSGTLTDPRRFGLLAGLDLTLTVLVARWTTSRSLNPHSEGTRCTCACSAHRTRRCDLP